VRLSLPLMAGVSLVTADNWIIAHFASNTSGAVSLMSYAKQLFTAPMAMLAQAAGAASMPFFASLWSQQRRYEFAVPGWRTRSRAWPRWGCWRLGHGGAGRAAGGVALSRRPLFPADARECAAYFAIFSVSMFLWSAQAIYSRAFYAAGNTFVPMLAGTVVTVVSWPIYWRSTTGMEPWGWRSLRIGIALQTGPSPCCCTSAAWSRWPAWTTELGRCLLAALVSGTGVGLLFGWLDGALHAAVPGHVYWIDLAVLVAGSALWLLIVKWVLEKSGSALPRVAMKRLGLA
jgi:putative peptidoglycan lipid II flippase